MPAGASFTWFGEGISEEMRKAAVRGLKKAGSFARSEIVRRISVSSRIGSGGTVNPKPDGGPPVLLDHSKPGEPPRSNFGMLRKSIFYRVDEGGEFVEVGTSSMVGIYMEKGTAPHVIRPVNKKALVFGGGMEAWQVFRAGKLVRDYKGPVGELRVRQKGKKKAQGYLSATGGTVQTFTKQGVKETDWVFAKQVNHPGTAPRPFFESTLHQIMPDIRKIIESEIQGVLGWGGAGIWNVTFENPQEP